MLLPYLNKNQREAGCDEAGRGCYAGPVFAAAVILPPDFHHPLLNDSKQVSEKNRNILRPILEKEAIAFSVATASVEEIDSINILQASYLAMHRAIKSLKKKPEYLLIDGNRFKPYPKISHECVIKGDGKFASIAAASILAKTHRDEYMHRIHQEFPQYRWDQNKGYGTATHRNALLKYGITPHHRRSFQILPPQMPLFR
ncbi:MAG: ribonuclease HII [Bacteroidota bacterium]